MIADDLVYEVRTAVEPQVAPDGGRMLYALSQADRTARTEMPKAALWTCALDGSDARPLTTPGHRDGAARWSPDSSRVAFASDRGKEQGLFVVPADGGEPMQVARHPLRINWLCWSPDGRSLAYTVPVDPPEPSRGPDPFVRVTRRIDFKEDMRGYLGDRRTQVFLAAADGSGVRQLTDEPLDHVHPLWSPDGRTIAVRLLRAVGFRSELALIDVATGEVRTIGVGDAGTVSLFCWSPQGDRLLVAGEPERTSQPDLYVLTTDDLQLRRLSDNLLVVPDAGYPNSIPPAVPVWLDDQRALFHGLSRGRSGIWVVDVDSGSLGREVEWEAQHVGLSSDAAHRYIVQTHTSHSATGEIVIFDRETKQTSIVTRFNTEVLQPTQPASEVLTFERGGLTIESWLLFPPGFDERRRYPLVLNVHGGPHGHNGFGFAAPEQAFARSGFLVLSPNPRGSGTYGRAFATRVLQDWGGEDYLDLLAAVDQVCERPYVDHDRLGVYGYSYGGFMTSWIIGHTDRFQAAVCGAPCFDLFSFYGTSDIGSDFGVTQWGGTPHERPEWFREHSPSTFAQRATTPTLIVHGEADERCPIGQGEELFVTLLRSGCEAEFVRYPGAGHLFLRAGNPAQRADMLGRSVDWLRRHLTD